MSITRVLDAAESVCLPADRRDERRDGIVKKSAIEQGVPRLVRVWSRDRAGRRRGARERDGDRADDLPRTPPSSQETQIAPLKRSLNQLVGWLFKALDFPVGVVLLTGTAVIPAVAFHAARRR